MKFLPSFLHSFTMGWLGAWQQKTALVSLVVSYLIGKGLWVSVWTMVPDVTLARLGLGYDQIIWYAVLTGCVNYPLVRAYRVIEEDIHTGALGSFLSRPVGHVTLRLGEAVGGALLRAAVLAPFAVLFSVLVTGTWLLSGWAIPAWILSVALGIVLWTLLHMLIGFSASWMRSARPVFMLVGKGVLVLGGVIMPISLYPGWVQTLAWSTPFPAMLYIPAHWTLETVSLSSALTGLSVQLFWIVLTGTALALASCMAEQRFIRRGGA
ncbi:MAG: hypothetical protein M3O22_00585 [Pseudomonadota bacterium]|nr:hypothetical protein [Pseudomonadota bacterium]